MQSEQLVEIYTISIRDNVLVATVNKRFSVEEFRDMLIDMKHIALKKNIKRLLVDSLTIDFSDLGISERHEIGLAAVEVLSGYFRAVSVLQRQFINQHGENVAINRGADVLVTDSIEEGFAWLKR